MRTTKLAYLLPGLLILASCNQHNPTNESFYLEHVASPFIKPPLPAANVPFKKFTFLAEQGDTILYKSGSIILFPKNALVDKDGTIIKGNVDIQYREFSNPLDFYLSGIPMQYDSAGIKYTFESAGMCEINASQNGKALFVNPNAKPQINLASHNSDAVFNLYQLDTVQKKWINKGKDTITDFSHALNKNNSASIQTASNDAPLACPVKPLKESGKNPVIDVTVDPASFQELRSYNNLKFEIIDTKNINTNDTLEEWSDIHLEKTNETGIYIARFSNSKKEAAYKVRPVLKEADYAIALKVFDAKMELYKKQLNNRVATEYYKAQQNKQKIADDKMQQEKWQAENDRIVRLNKIIEAENKQTDSINKIILAENNQVEKRKKERDETNKLIEARNKRTAEEIKRIEIENKKALDASIKKAKEEKRKAIEVTQKMDIESRRQIAGDLIIRGFAINGFGVWNCDHPSFPGEEIPITANFKDSTNKEITVSTVAVIYKGFNGITQYGSSKIRVIPNKDNMIFGVVDSNFVYLPYDDFKKYVISRDTKTATFTMRTHKNTNDLYDDITTLLQANGIMPQYQRIQ